jgi:hypothetical protein
MWEFEKDVRRAGRLSAVGQLAALQLALNVAPFISVLIDRGCFEQVIQLA